MAHYVLVKGIKVVEPIPLNKEGLLQRLKEGIGRFWSTLVGRNPAVFQQEVESKIEEVYDELMSAAFVNIEFQPSSTFQQFFDAIAQFYSDLDTAVNPQQGTPTIDEIEDKVRNVNVPSVSDIEIPLFVTIGIGGTGSVVEVKTSVNVSKINNILNQTYQSILSNLGSYRALSRRQTSQTHQRGGTMDINQLARNTAMETLRKGLRSTIHIINDIFSKYIESLPEVILKDDNLKRIIMATQLPQVLAERIKEKLEEEGPESEGTSPYGDIKGRVGQALQTSQLIRILSTLSENEAEILIRQFFSETVKREVEKFKKILKNHTQNLDNLASSLGLKIKITLPTEEGRTPAAGTGTSKTGAVPDAVSDFIASLWKVWKDEVKTKSSDEVKKKFNDFLSELKRKLNEGELDIEAKVDGVLQGLQATTLRAILDRQGVLDMARDATKEVDDLKRAGEDITFIRRYLINEIRKLYMTVQTEIGKQSQSRPLHKQIRVKPPKKPKPIKKLPPLPKAVEQILLWWKNLTPEGKRVISNILHSYLTETNPDIRKALEKELIEVAKKLGIPIRALKQIEKGEFDFDEE